MLAFASQLSVRPYLSDRLHSIDLALKFEQYNGQCGEVLSWQGDRWIVDLDSKERKCTPYRPAQQKANKGQLLLAKVAERECCLAEPVRMSSSSYGA
eukprot:1497631-Amphidinium_carterae.1